jgi:hypothetical protein
MRTSAILGPVVVRIGLVTMMLRAVAPKSPEPRSWSNGSSVAVIADRLLRVVQEQRRRAGLVAELGPRARERARPRACCSDRRPSRA